MGVEGFRILDRACHFYRTFFSFQQRPLGQSFSPSSLLHLHHFKTLIRYSLLLHHNHNLTSFLPAGLGTLSLLLPTKLNPSYFLFFINYQPLSSLHFVVSLVPIAPVDLTVLLRRRIHSSTSNCDFGLQLQASISKCLTSQLYSQCTHLPIPTQWRIPPPLRRHRITQSQHQSQAYLMSCTTTLSTAQLAWLL